ncbi:extracellular solute-binding protein [Paenibacillus pasadenensis]|uniref:extracellular solute-binding protein n=1 Tax=Paenibacillus pasadenensis TaxID=217090 RepID=UPI00203E0717|nr:extracellular solute-binding protein [Paenibacillus pasadenensis]MCM3749056.1 extracellular solute-binding protein [Paenibacillus pasadenensis]
MKYRKPLIYLAIIAVVVGYYSIKSVTDKNSFTTISADNVKVPEKNDQGIPFYQSLLRENTAAGKKSYAGQPIEIQAAAYTTVSGSARTEKVKDAESGTEVLDWKNGSGAVEWEIDIPEDGLYNLEVLYTSASESSVSINYGLKIDGKAPFAEAGSIEFVKHWRDKTVPYNKDVLGNEIRSQQVQIPGWKSMVYSDFNLSSKPLEFYLAKGKHTIRFEAQNEPMLWKTIRFIAPAQIPAYAEYLKNADAKSEGKSWFTKIEAELYKQKSHTSVQTGSRNEAHVSPDPAGRIKYNVIDGERWKKPGEWIEWEFEVPETGMYELDVKYFQRYQGNTNVYRTIAIDGKVPFSEMLHYTFPYNKRLDIYTLQDTEGKPYQFHLEKGKHVIRMTADASGVNSPYLSLSETIDDIYELEREVRKVTGDYGANSGDSTRTWDLASYIPDIKTRLQSIRDRLDAITGYLNGMNQNSSTATNTIKTGISIVDDMMADVDKIPNSLRSFADAESKLGAWFESYNLQGMTVDYLVVREPGTKTGLKESGALIQAPYMLGNFFRTFYQKYDTREFNEKESLNVWIGRNRDYANLLQEMINQEFTQKYGIKVNVNLMPDPNALILSNAGGDQPDAVLGVWQDTPVDFAMRGAAADLTKFSDYEEIVKRFHPGGMRAFQYNQGVFALPETQIFHLMFYRKSVMERLGEELPQTWDDVKKLLPSLQEAGMTFYYPNKDFAPFFYMNGAEFYSEDGLRPGFNTDGAYDGFKLWAELFTKYGLPKDVPSFFNHFKLGDMPIGVADFNTYLQLLSSAPEIRGDWGVAPMPGIAQGDGEIARWAQNGQMASMILDKSDKKEEAWTFLKWWTSDEVQRQYGSNIESYFGVEYRWNTANMNALATMPWSPDDLSAILEQNRWIKNVPNVPGGYFLTRELEFAWNRVVVDKVPPKESLDKSISSLEKEMLRKQKNLGITSSQDLRMDSDIKPYDWGASR